MSKVSIIVPVYNAEKYLDECVESLIKQTYQDLDIILVNDQSTDNSGDICNAWATKDNRIKAIHKENGGGARGAVLKGLQLACGEYTMFLDADDFYKPTAVETLLNQIISTNADCVQFNYTYFSNGEETTKTTRHYEELNKADIEENVLKGFIEGGGATQYSYGRTDKIYKTQILKKVVPLLDAKVTIYEDMDMSLYVAAECEKIVILPENNFYVWRYVPNSISRRMIDKTIAEHEYFMQAVEKFADRFGYYTGNIAQMKDKIYSDLIIMALINDIPVKKKTQYLKNILSKIKDKAAIKRLAQRQAIATKVSLMLVYSNIILLPSIMTSVYIKLFLKAGK